MANDTTIQIIIEGENKSSPAFKEATKQADGFGKSIAKSIGVFAAAQVAGTLLSGTIEKISSSLKGLTAGSLQMAGKFQEMEFAALALGRAMGHTEDTIRSSIADLREAGIRSDVAAKTTATLARNQIDLAKSFDLARVAQATGILVGQDSSATMERLVQAVTVGNTRILRTMGIMVDFNKIVEEGAGKLGKSVEALTQRELAELRVQGVLDNSAAIMSVYGAAMESPTKALRSLTGRVIPEFQAALGQSFLPAWKTVISTISDATKWFTTALKEGGALYPLMIQLGAGASLAADTFKNLVRAVIPIEPAVEKVNLATQGMTIELQRAAAIANSAGSSFTTNLITKLADAADKALRGGIEISAGLAEGLIKGAAGALTSAMTFIGGLLSSWLSPGSPPKVAKKIVKWGAATFTEYLKGFTEADFSSLEALQKPIADVLSSLVDAGAMGSKAASSTFKSLTLDISKALTAFKETGQIDTSIFTKLADVGGQYGKQLAKLAKKQFEFAAASIAAEKAQEALAKAMEAQDKSQDKLNAIMEDFNQALRDGADPAVLNAKRQAFLDAKKQAEQAKKEVKLADKQNKSTQKRIKPLQKQVGLQEKLLRQLLEFTKIEKTPGGGLEGIAAAAGGGVGGGAAEAIAGVMPTAADFDIGSPITDAISSAKELLTERFSNLFSPITDAWEEVQPDLDLLKEQWGIFTGQIADVVEEKWPIIKETIIGAWEGIVNVWNTVLKPALEGLWLFLKDNLLIVMLAIIPPLWTLIIPGFLAWAAATIVAIGPIILLGLALIALGLLWKKYGEQIKKTVNQIKIIIVIGLNRAATSVKSILGNMAIILGAIWDAIKLNTQLVIDAIRTKIEETLIWIEAFWAVTWEAIKVVFNKIVRAILSKVQDLVDKFEKFRDKIQQVKDMFAAIATYIRDTILPKFAELATFVDETLKPIFQTFLNVVLTPFKNAFEFLSKAASDFVGWIRAIAAELGNIDIPDWMNPGSPPPLAFALMDISKAMRDLTTIDLPQFSGQLRNLGRGGTEATGTTIHYEQTINTSANDVIIPGYDEMVALIGA